MVQLADGTEGLPDYEIFISCVGELRSWVPDDYVLDPFEGRQVDRQCNHTLDMNLGWCDLEDQVCIPPR